MSTLEAPLGDAGGAVLTSTRTAETVGVMVVAMALWPMALSDLALSTMALSTMALSMMALSVSFSLRALLGLGSPDCALAIPPEGVCVPRVKRIALPFAWVELS